MQINKHFGNKILETRQAKRRLKVIARVTEAPIKDNIHKHSIVDMNDVSSTFITCVNYKLCNLLP